MRLSEPPGTRHPCWEICSVKLRRIIESRKQVGQWGPGEDIEVSCTRPWRQLTKNDVLLACPHGREYWLVPNKAFNDRPQEPED